MIAAFFNQPTSQQPQLAHVPKILRDAEILIQTERLCQITNKRPRVDGRLAVHLRLARRRLHHAAKHLEHRGLTRTVWSNDSADLAGRDIEVDALDRLESAVILHEASHLDRGPGKLVVRCQCTDDGTRYGCLNRAHGPASLNR